MQIRSFRGSGEPAWVIALPSACERLGPDPRSALGPAAIDAPTGRTRDRTRPMLQIRQKVLARAPSTRDATFVGRGKTYAGKAQIKKLFMANQAFNPKNSFVAYTPPSRFKDDIEGDTGHVVFECIQLNRATNKIVPNTHVRLTADVVRVNGHWLIKRAKGAHVPKLWS